MIKRYLIAGLLIVIALLATYACTQKYQKDRLARQADDQLAQLEKLELERAGWHQARSTVVDLPDVPTPPPAAGKPEASLRIQTVEVQVPVPSPCSPTVVELPSVGATVESPQQLTVGLTTDVQARLDLTKAGKIYWVGAINSVMKPSWSSHPISVEQPLSPTSELGISPTLQSVLDKGLAPPQRFRLLPRSPKKWRTGLAVGLGCSLQHSPECGPLVLWGVQF
jgi:hypothetical protein